MSYNLGAIWLQVIPSFDGVHEAGRAAGREAGKGFNKGFDEEENKRTPQREKDAEDRGKRVGDAEARGRTKAQKAADERDERARQRHNERIELLDKKHRDTLAQGEAAQNRQMAVERERHRREQAAKDADYWRGRQAAQDAHNRELARLEARKQRDLAVADEKGSQRRRQIEAEHHRNIEKANNAHTNRLAEMEAARDADRAKRAQQLNDKLVELDKRGQNDLAKERERARLRLDRDETAFERRRQVNLEKLQTKLLKRAMSDPDSFDRAMNRVIENTMAKSRLDQEIDLDIDSTEADAKIAEIKARLEALRDAHIGIDIDAAGAVSEIMAIQRMVDSLDREDIDIRVDVDMGAAAAQLMALEAATTSAARRQADLADGFRQSDSSAGGAANAFRAMNGVLLATVTIGPILVPILMSIAGALMAVATFALAAGAGIGAGMLGLMGVGDAIGALNDLESEQTYGGDASARTASRSRHNAARGVRDATRGVDRAQAAALDANTRAEKNLARAQEDALRAQERLTEARARARREIEDLNNSLISGVMAEKDAMYDLEEARFSLFKIMNDGSATQREKDRAQLAYDIQVQRFKELQLQNDRLGEDKAVVDEKGVEGLPSVVDAQRAAVDAEAAVAEAAQNVTDTRVEGAERIRDAEERLADALLNQQDVLADTANGTGALSTAVTKLQEAMDNLSPAGKRFALFLFGLKPYLDELRFAAQEGLLPGLQGGIETSLNTYEGRLLKFVGDMSKLLGDNALNFAEWLTQPEVVEFFDLMAEYSLIFLDQFFKAMEHFSNGMIPILNELLPFAKEFGDFLLGLAESFDEWANSEEGQKQIAAFFGYLRDISPQTLELVSLFFRVVVKTLIGLAPYIDRLMEFFIGILEWADRQDPDRLAKIALGIMAIVAAFQLLAGFLSVVLTTVGMIASIKAVGGILGGIATKFGFSAGTAGAGGAIGGAAGKGGIRGALGFLSKGGWIGLAISAVLFGLLLLWENRDLVKEWWEQNVSPVLTWFGEKFTWLWENVISPIWDLIKLAFDIGATFIEVSFKLIWVAIQILGDWFTWLYEEVVKPWWENDIQPVLRAFGDFWGEYVTPLIEKAADKIGEIWAGIKQKFAEPVVWVIDTVINDGLIKGLNWVFDHFDIPPVDPITIPASLRSAANPTKAPVARAGSGSMLAYADGGVLPGFTPGVDVHTFTSPTGGTLRLSGGEGILVPEVVRELGPETIDAWNTAARGGRGSAPGSYASGGILETLGTAWDFLTNPIDALNKVVERLIGGLTGVRMDSPVAQMITALPSRIISGIGGALRNLLTPGTGQYGMIGMSGVAPGPGGWAVPSRGPLTSMFGATAGRRYPHAGIDIAGGGPTFAAADGQVIKTGWNILSGRTGIGILLGHGGGVFTYYGHNPVGGVVVSNGDQVEAGQRIGAQGATGNVTGTHLHFETHEGGVGRVTDPLAFLRRRGVQLRDQGGMLDQGLNYILNASGNDEYILTQQQLQALAQRGSGGGGTIINVAVTKSGASANEIASEINYEIFRHKRGGVYA